MNCHCTAARKMMAGPSGSAFRSGSQTGPSCCVKKTWWLAWKKSSRRDLGQVSVQKASVSKPTDDASLRCQVSSKSGALFSPEKSPRGA